jgi:hypothetical protein
MHWRSRLRGLKAPAPERVAVLDPAVKKPAFGRRALKLLMHLRFHPDIGVGVTGPEESDVEFTICR